MDEFFKGFLSEITKHATLPIMTTSRITNVQILRSVARRFDPISRTITLRGTSGLKDAIKTSSERRV